MIKILKQLLSKLCGCSATQEGNGGELSEIYKNYLRDRPTLTDSELLKKYKGKLPCDQRISAMVRFIMKEKLHEAYVSKVYYADKRDPRQYMLMTTLDGQYMTFTSERGTMAAQRVFPKLEDALFDLLDTELQAYDCSAPDSKIK